MVRISGVLMALMIITATSAEIDQPLSETRLTIHTLLREDIFAGLLENDMQRLTRGEKNLQLLLKQRPEAKALLLGWQASTVLYRATRAHESGRAHEYREHYQRSLALFDEANRLDNESVGVAAVTGGLVCHPRRPLAERGSSRGLVKGVQRFPDALETTGARG